MTASVPGNLILAGEYVVLEEEGLGVVCAVDRRVRLLAERAPCLFVEGLWPGGSFQWSPQASGARPASPIISAVYETVQEWRRQHKRGDIPNLRVSIDSSELYSADGRKTGLGSSAAVTVALVVAMNAGRVDLANARLALSAHRLAQGGVGSGYDVYCSFFGGWGLFKGGIEPTWKQHAPLVNVRLYLFAGPAAVSTKGAVQSYSQWKDGHRKLAARLISESNTNVAAFTAAGSAREIAHAFRKARETSIALGDEIGVDARIPVPAGVDADLCKALGAGNELGVYLLLPGAPEPPASSGLTPLIVAAKGVVCNL